LGGASVTSNTVTVLIRPTVTLTANPNPAAAGVAIRMTASGSLDDGTGTYTWLDANGIMTAIQSPVREIAFVEDNGNVPSVWTVFVTYKLRGATATNNLPVTFNATPTVSLSPATSTVQVGVPIVLTAVGTPPGGTYRFEWSSNVAGATMTSTGAKATFISTAAGDFIFAVYYTQGGVETLVTSASTATATVTPPTVGLTATKSTLDLMQTNSYNVVISPNVAPPNSVFSVEIKRLGSDSWYVLSGSQITNNLVHRVAGTFVLRGVLQYNGKFLYSPEYSIIVQFPNITTIISEITGDADAAWASTLAATSDGSRREQGWWVTLDTSTGKYGKAGAVIGTIATNDIDAGLKLPDMPADTPVTPNPLGSSVYVVGFFHTHTPTTFRTAVNIGSAAGRRTGPSDVDNGFGSAWKVPGIAYDYVIDSAPPLYPLNSPAKMYSTESPDRRPTP
jgi:hypothetical protein